MLKGKIFASGQEFVGRVELTDEELGAAIGGAAISATPECITNSGCIEPCLPIRSKHNKLCKPIICEPPQ